MSRWSILSHGTEHQPHPMGATKVTLLRSTTRQSKLRLIRAGSALLSPENRHNPEGAWTHDR